MLVPKVTAFKRGHERLEGPVRYLWSVINDGRNLQLIHRRNAHTASDNPSYIPQMGLHRAGLALIPIHGRWTETATENYLPLSWVSFAYLSML